MITISSQRYFQNVTSLILILKKEIDKRLREIFISRTTSTKRIQQLSTTKQSSAKLSRGQSRGAVLEVRAIKL